MAIKMSITRIETTSVSIPYQFPWRNRRTEERGYPTTHLDITVLQVHTDAGIVGLGEMPGKDARKVMAEKYEPFLKGRDPFEIQQVLMDLDQTFGRSSALAGIELALHDIVGKALGVPVYTLLGGKVRDRIPLIWTLTHRSIEEQVSEARERVAEGFTHALKMKTGMAGDLEHELAVARRLARCPSGQTTTRGSTCRRF